jgi:hypothetical protein
MGSRFLTGVASGCWCNSYDDGRYSGSDNCQTNGTRHVALCAIC